MVRQLRLNTHENARRSYCRIIQSYLRGEMPTEQARTLGYMMTGLLQFYRHDLDRERWIEELKIEERLQLIEEQLKGNHGHT